MIDNPTVIVEVLSPSSEKDDRGDKFRDYRLLSSLRDYVLVSTKRPAVEVFSRQDDGSWNLRVYVHGSTAHLPSVGVDLPLDELYEKRGLRRADLSASGHRLGEVDRQGGGPEDGDHVRVPLKPLACGGDGFPGRARLPVR